MEVFLLSDGYDDASDALEYQGEFGDYDYEVPDVDGVGACAEDASGNERMPKPMATGRISLVWSGSHVSVGGTKLPKWMCNLYDIPYGTKTGVVRMPKGERIPTQLATKLDLSRSSRVRVVSERTFPKYVAPSDNLGECVRKQDAQYRERLSAAPKAKRVSKRVGKTLETAKSCTRARGDAIVAHRKLLSGANSPKAERVFTRAVKPRTKVASARRGLPKLQFVHRNVARCDLVGVHCKGAKSDAVPKAALDAQAAMLLSLERTRKPAHVPREFVREPHWVPRATPKPSAMRTNALLDAAVYAVSEAYEARHEEGTCDFGRKLWRGGRIATGSDPAFYIPGTMSIWDADWADGCGKPKPLGRKAEGIVAYPEPERSRCSRVPAMQGMDRPRDGSFFGWDVRVLYVVDTRDVGTPLGVCLSPMGKVGGSVPTWAGHEPFRTFVGTYSLSPLSRGRNRKVYVPLPLKGGVGNHLHLERAPTPRKRKTMHYVLVPKSLPSEVAKYWAKALVGDLNIPFWDADVKERAGFPARLVRQSPGNSASFVSGIILSQNGD